LKTIYKPPRLKDAKKNSQEYMPKLKNSHLIYDKYNIYDSGNQINLTKGLK